MLGILRKQVNFNKDFDLKWLENIMLLKRGDNIQNHKSEKNNII